MNPVLTASPVAKGNADQLVDETASGAMKPGLDVYFSADVETDGPIPGPFSILSFALVFAGTFDGQRFTVPQNYQQSFYRELKPISDDFEPDALRVNGLDRAGSSNDGSCAVGQRNHRTRQADSGSLSTQLRLVLAVLVFYKVFGAGLPFQPFALLRHQDSICGQSWRTHL